MLRIVLLNLCSVPPLPFGSYWWSLPANQLNSFPSDGTCLVIGCCTPYWVVDFWYGLLCCGLRNLIHLLHSVAVLVNIPSVCWTAWCSSNALDFPIWEVPSLNVCWVTSCFYWSSPPPILLSCRCQISPCSLSASFQFLYQFILHQTCCQCYVCNWWHQSQQEGGGTNYRSLEGSLGSSYVAYIFVCLGNTIICQLFKLSLSDQVQVILQLRVGTFRTSIKIF